MQKTIKKTATKETYGKILVELGDKNSRIVVVEADLMKASGSDPFMKRFPERHFNVGIAEQNLIGVAGGLAAMGKVPFASSFACFAARRACDQVMIAAAYNNFNVKIVGTYAGLSSEKNGGTHASIADITIFRAMPNMVVLVPGDCVEFAGAMKAAAEHEGPVYISIARGPLPEIFPDDYSFEIGKSIVMQQGQDITLITTGITTWEGMQACEILKSNGIDVEHLHLPTIKPLDANAIINSAKKTGRIITVENQSVLGGLGSAVAEVICDSYPVPVKRMGMPDCFSETATLDYLLNKFELSSEHIAKAVEKLLKKNT